MWPAPTAVDWARPCLLTFQRTWADARAVSQETGKPILICVNMDGEIASEHYAGIRYRDPAIAALYQPYVCVIASVYRHTPRDYDDQGHRILCPRFGSVTCGEHIAMEPIVFARFLDGRRVAPRHIAVDLDGQELYDVYYANDTASVFQAIAEGPSRLPAPKPPIVRGDRPILERVGSREVSDRTAVENAYVHGDEALRSQLIEAARQHSQSAPLDLLRLALFGLDVDLGQAARRALAQVSTPAATDLISEALQVPLQPAERDRLIAALKRLGKSSARARWLAGVHQGLGEKSTAVDPAAWQQASGASYRAAPPGGLTLSSTAEAQAQAVFVHPQDPNARLKLAESTLHLALEAPRTYAGQQHKARLFATHLTEEAQRTAREAEALGAKGWRLDTLLALTAYYQGETKEAYARAEAAMKNLPGGESGWSSMAVVTVFAESRWKAIQAAVRADEPWPPKYLADLDAAYAVLQRHPLGTAGQVLWHYEFLEWLGAGRRSARVLQQGLARFKTSEVLHQRLRDRILRQRGPQALEAAYEAMLQQQHDPAHLEPFAGLACAVAADQLRRTRKFPQALTAYEHAITHYEKAVQADAAHAPGAAHAIALLRAGRARVAYEVGDLDLALGEILASFRRHPESAGSRDGMGITPGETAQVLRTSLQKAGREKEAAQLKAALEQLDPDLLQPEIGLRPGDR